MKKIIILLIVMLILPLMGCSDKYTLYSTRSALISKENNILESQFASTKEILKLKRSKFTDEEWRKLINTSSTIDMLIEKYDAIAKLNSAEVSVIDVEFLWQLASAGFYQAREVVVKKYNQLPPSTQVMVKSFDARVSEIDSEVASLISSPSEDNINDALVLISGTLNYSARMVSIVATSL